MIRALFLILAFALAFGPAIAPGMASAAASGGAAGPDIFAVADASMVAGADGAMADDADCAGCGWLAGGDAVACEGGCPVPCGVSAAAGLVPAGLILRIAGGSGLRMRPVEPGLPDGQAVPPNPSPPDLTI